MEDVLTERFDRGHATPLAATAPHQSGDESDAALARVLHSLDEDKAEDVIAIDLRGKSPVADHMVIASGRSARQVSAISEKLIERVKAAAGRAPRAEGLEAGDWVLIDCGDVIVHVFRPEVRAFYALEKMWMEPAEIRARAAASA
jgi:ribosome-associated protein